MKQKKAIQKLRAFEKVGPSVEVPWSVLRLFPDGFKQIDIGCSSDLSFGGDYASVPECRKALEWLASQLGGTVKWEK